MQTSLLWDVFHDGHIGRYGAASELKSGVFRVCAGSGETASLIPE